VLPARPTLRTLREDLKIPVPPVSEPLNEIGHPLLAKAREQFADENAPHERIRAIDDQVLFKVKARRWRGAVWIEELLPWVVAAGRPARTTASATDWRPGPGSVLPWSQQ
jgi:hypothetical protein